MARMCLPKCVQPVFRTCDKPYEDEVSLCCFEIDFPNDYTTDGNPPETIDCSHGVYSCDPSDPYGIFHSVTNYRGVVGASYSLDVNEDGWFLCTDGTIETGVKRHGWHGLAPECWQIVYADAVTCSINLATTYWTDVLEVPIELVPGFVPDFVVQWECVGNGVIRIRAGIACGPLEEYGGGTPCAYKYHLSDMRFFCTIFEGFFTPDWWRSNVIGPGPAYGPVLLPCIDFGDPGDSLEFGISNDCTWIPCGDPLDCFADCISGSVECDGVTPAHVPVVFLTLTHLVSNGLGCCFVGTYPLEFGADTYAGTGYYLFPDATCTAPTSGITYRMKASLTCGSLSGYDAPGWGAGSNHANLIVQFFAPGSTLPNAIYGAVISLGCTDGVLNDSSGAWSGTGCGLFGVIGWAISV